MIEYRFDILIILILFMLMYLVRKVRVMEYQIDCVHEFVHHVEGMVEVVEHSFSAFGFDEDDNNDIMRNAEEIRKWDLGEEE